MKSAVLIAAAVIGLIRPALLFVEVGPHLQSSYEAAAHILVGALFGVWYVGRQRKWALAAVVILSVIEVACAAVKFAGLAPVDAPAVVEPVEIHAQISCPQCGGKGSYFRITSDESEGGRVTCSRCKGTGILEGKP